MHFITLLYYLPTCPMFMIKATPRRECSMLFWVSSKQAALWYGFYENKFSSTTGTGLHRTGGRPWFRRHSLSLALARCTFRNLNDRIIQTTVHTLLFFSEGLLSLQIRLRLLDLVRIEMRKMNREKTTITFNCQKLDPVGLQKVKKNKRLIIYKLLITN